MKHIMKIKLFYLKLPEDSFSDWYNLAAENSKKTKILKETQQ